MNQCVIKKQTHYYTDPKTVGHSNYKVSNVIFDGQDVNEDSYSIALLNNYGEKRYAIRWNIQKSEIGKNINPCIGFPYYNGTPQWFVLPRDVSVCRKVTSVVSETDRKDLYNELMHRIVADFKNLNRLKKGDGILVLGKDAVHYEIRVGVQGKPYVQIRLDSEPTNTALLKDLRSKCSYASDDTSMISTKNTGIILFETNVPLSVKTIAAIFADIYNDTHDYVGL